MKFSTPSKVNGITLFGTQVEKKRAELVINEPRLKQKGNLSLVEGTFTSQTHIQTSHYMHHEMEGGKWGAHCTNLRLATDAVGWE